MVQNNPEIKLNKLGNRRGMHPNSRQNLRCDANLHGRPKKADCLLSCIKEELEKVAVNGQTNEQLIASVLVGMATRGNIKAVELMMSYLHAKPSQSFDLANRGDKPFFIINVSSEHTKELTERAGERLNAT